MIAPEKTIPKLVLGAAERHAQLRALEEGELKLSFAELAERCIQAAAAFRASGIQRGDRVAIWAPNQWEWVIAAIGLQGAGAALVPLNTRMKGGEAAYILQKSRSVILCTVGEFVGNRYVEMLRAEKLPDLREIVALRGAVEGTVSFEKFLTRGDSMPRERAREMLNAVEPDDLADIMFTSGTTGRPKGVMTTHAQNMAVYNVWAETVGLRRGDHYLVIGPFFHGFGYKAGWLAGLIVGATIFPHAIFEPKAVLERVAREKITVMPGPPTIYQTLLAMPDRSKCDTRSLRLAVTGAAAVPVELVHRMRRELGFESVITAYGLTETSGTVSICRQDDSPETIATTSGCAIPGVEVKCVNAEGKEVPRGEAGEIWVRGYNNMKGYLDDPEETAKTIDREGWLHTGDVGVMDARGYLQITDRVKDMFINGGFNCYPAEIENGIFEHPAVQQVAVIGIPDERMGEVGMAFVVRRPGAKLEAAELIAWCREKMANYKVPRRVEFLAELPQNASGKVLKFELRKRAQATA
jgi:acyl-CoA synthetase (AMP-forming)/AMP-acid ligase II